MLREREAFEDGDRERREALEALQVQVREARQQLAALQRPPNETSEAERLRAELADATTRLKDAQAERPALEQELAALELEVPDLTKRVEEQEVLARGAERRNQTVEWLPQDSSKKPPPPQTKAGRLQELGVFAFLFGFTAALGNPVATALTFVGLVYKAIETHLALREKK